MVGFDTPANITSGVRIVSGSIKAVILAGGLGSRLAEETVARPKPMVEIGGQPILWHIMKIYGSYGIQEFVICLGYKGYMIKEYFANYFLHTSDVTFDLANNAMQTLSVKSEPWRVTLIDTGDSSMTGGRLKRAIEHVRGDEFFCMTYGDGVSNVDISALLASHIRSGRLATVTGIQPPGRFGALRTTEDAVVGFQEKPAGDGGWINGGFFVLSPKVGDYIKGDETIWEREPMEALAHEGQLGLYRHHGFWQPMDTMRDKSYLEQLWAGGAPPWRIWST
jgi:glucose-1-phosphate cytidylyltransferase